MIKIELNKDEIEVLQWTFKALAQCFSAKVIEFDGDVEVLQKGLSGLSLKVRQAILNANDKHLENNS